MLVRNRTQVFPAENLTRQRYLQSLLQATAISLSTNPGMPSRYSWLRSRTLIYPADLFCLFCAYTTSTTTARCSWCIHCSDLLSYMIRMVIWQMTPLEGNIPCQKTIVHIARRAENRDSSSSVNQAIDSHETLLLKISSSETQITNIRQKFINFGSSNLIINSCRLAAKHRFNMINIGECRKYDNPEL